MLIGSRSDLLSRHVNKAHRAPEEGATDKKPTKKGRRKSVPASSQSALARARIQEQDEEQRRQLLQRQQFECQQQQQQLLQQQMQQEAAAVRERSKSESLNQQPHLQALRMYPHHPLLASRPVQPSIASDSWNTNPSGSFAAAGMTAMTAISPPFDSTPQRLGGNFQTFQGQPFLVGQLPNDPPFTGQPMRLSGSDQGMKTADGHSASVLYEWGVKKRACDQCNHSKVRCDFADPCRKYAQPR